MQQMGDHLEDTHGFVHQARIWSVAETTIPSVPRNCLDTQDSLTSSASGCRRLYSSHAIPSRANSLKLVTLEKRLNGFGIHHVRFFAALITSRRITPEPSN